MFKKIFFAIVFQGGAMLFTLSSVEGFAQEGVLKIQVMDKMNGEGLELANVMVENGGLAVCKGLTDPQGNLVFKNLAPGKYDVTTTYTGYPKNIITGVLIKNHETTYLDVELSSENLLGVVDITIYKKPLVDPNTVIKTTYDLEEIKASPLDPVEMVQQQGTSTGEGITPSYRGARNTSNVYIVDGMPVTHYNLPTNSIQQISVSLGGVPAQYGDGTGAFIEIETRSGLVKPDKK